MDDGVRVALVTGASEGIGAAIARRVGSDGWTIALASRDEARLRPVTAGIDADARTFSVDLADPAGADGLVAQVAKAFGRIDLIVHCASATRFGSVLGLSDEEWVAGFDVKVLGGLRLMRAAWPHLMSRRGGIINICGIGARTPRDATAMSGPLSAALVALTKVFADRGVADGVRVNAINPGPILTPRLTKMLDERASAEGTDRASLIAAMVRDAGATRIGTPEDVAALVAFIASDQAQLLHGAIIDLDGGITKGL